MIRSPTLDSTIGRRVVQRSLNVIRQEAELMCRAMDSGSIGDVLKHGSFMISELRAPELSPCLYYELYTAVLAELQRLFEFFADTGKHNQKLAELYESVQHAGFVLPRLYLLITVGALCIKFKEITTTEVLRDLNELCKGVQQPMRGLFLRNYLSQMVKLVCCCDEATGNDVGGDSVNGVALFEFFMVNCTESAKLWGRLQFQRVALAGFPQELEKWNADMNAARVLIDSNIGCMAQLRSMSPTFFRDVALPKLLALVASTRDGVTQHHLLENIVQVFDVECLIAALAALLASTAKLFRTVNVRVIYVRIVERLTAYLKDSPNSLIKDAVKTAQVTKSCSGETQNPEALEPTVTGSKIPTSAIEYIGAPMMQEAADNSEVSLKTTAPTTSEPCNVITLTMESGTPADEGVETSTKARLNTSAAEAKPAADSTTTTEQSSVEAHDIAADALRLHVFSVIKESIMDVIQHAYDLNFGVQVMNSTDGQPNSENPNGRRDNVGGGRAAARGGVGVSHQGGPRNSKVCLSIEELTGILVEVCRFTVGVIPNCTDVVDEVFQLLFPLVTHGSNPLGDPSNIEQGSQGAAETVQLVVEILRLPFAPGASIHKPLQLLQLSHFTRVLNVLPARCLIEVLDAMIPAICSAQEKIRDVALLEQLYGLVGVAVALPAPPKRASDNVTEFDPTLTTMATPFCRWFIRCQAIAALVHLIPLVHDFCTNGTIETETGVLGPSPETLSGVCSKQLMMLLSVQVQLAQGSVDAQKLTLPSFVSRVLSFFHEVQRLELLLLQQQQQDVTSATGGDAVITASKLPPADDGAPDVPSAELSEPNTDCSGTLGPDNRPPPPPSLSPAGLPHDGVVEELQHKSPEASAPNIESSATTATTWESTDEKAVPAAVLSNAPSTTVVPKTSLGAKRSLHLVHSTCLDLVDINPEIGFRMLLDAAAAANAADQIQPTVYADICHEFIKQAIACLEENLSENKVRVRALSLIIGLLAGRITCLSEATFVQLAERLTRHASKLLRTGDRCRAILDCCHLFWRAPLTEAPTTTGFAIQDIERVVECIQHCLKLATDAFELSPLEAPSLILVLEEYLYFFKLSNDIPAEVVSRFMLLCAEQLALASSCVEATAKGLTKAAISSAQVHFQQIVAYIEELRQSNTKELREKFSEIDLSFIQLPAKQSPASSAVRPLLGDFGL